MVLSIWRKTKTTIQESSTARGLQPSLMSRNYPWWGWLSASWITPFPMWRMTTDCCWWLLVCCSYLQRMVRVYVHHVWSIINTSIRVMSECLQNSWYFVTRGDGILAVSMCWSYLKIWIIQIRYVILEGRQINWAQKWRQKRNRWKRGEVMEKRRLWKDMERSRRGRGWGRETKREGKEEWWKWGADTWNL